MYELSRTISPKKLLKIFL